MTGPNHSKKSTAGGVFIAVLTIAGVFVGGFMGQPTIGLLAGLALGIAISVGLWLKERAR